MAVRRPSRRSVSCCRRAGTGAAEDRDIAVAAARHFLHADPHHREAEADQEARGAGIARITTKWITFSGGGAQTDALLAGGVDILNTGTGNLLLLWDRTRGGVKGIVACSAQPMTLISRDPNIKSIRDFGPGDKIAVPTLKVSTQAIVLQIAACRSFRRRSMVEARCQYRAARPSRRLSCPLQPPASGAQSFLDSALQYPRIKNVPGAHVVLSSPDVMGGPLSQAQFFTTPSSPMPIRRSSRRCAMPPRKRRI